MLTTGGDEPAAVDRFGNQLGTNEQQVGEDDAHGEGEGDTHPGQTGDDVSDRGGRPPRRPDGGGGGSQHQDASGQGGIESTSHRVAQIGEGCVGVADEAPEVGHGQRDGQNASYHGHRLAESTSRSGQRRDPTRIQRGCDRDDPRSHHSPEPAGMKAAEPRQRSHTKLAANGVRAGLGASGVAVTSEGWC